MVVLLIGKMARGAMGGWVVVVLTTVRVSADVGVNARYAAENLARAQGWTKVQVFTVRPVGFREYEFDMNVSE